MDNIITNIAEMDTDAKGDDTLISTLSARTRKEETRWASPADVKQLELWNGKTASYPDEACLHDLFWAQAAKTPKAIAVVDGKKTMTYEELDEATDRLGAWLRTTHKIVPDAVVGIFMERSAEYVIAYLAILKAGGAYMPVELVYPSNLIARALAQTECRIVVTKSVHSSRLPSSVTAFSLDDLASTIPTTAPRMPRGGFLPRPTPDSLGFVVMSSGTTGTPKGICQVHRSAVHSYFDRFTRYPYHVDPRTKAVSDRVGAGVFFVWECIRPLLRGATCVVIPDDVLFDPESVTSFIQEHNVTRVLFTPSLLQLITDTLRPSVISTRLANLRMMWLCGEVVTVDLATSFTSLLPRCELLNLYSISECHDATIANLRTELDTTQKYATCGKNIPNVLVYVVGFEDETRRTNMRRMPIGQPGEVYVGGPVLARGYLKMPAKTAERFVPNPFGRPGKLYRTGDMGRILSDGTLEIVGRCDFMVKVRGYSVVLGAVEAALAKHPRLASAVVMALGAEGTDKRLVAWVVPTEMKRAPSAAHVRRFLKDYLPPYAIPGTFCVIESLPVNQSAAGKLDRKKLPDPDKSPRLRPCDEDEDDLQRTLPTTDLERTVLRVFADLLQTSSNELSTTDDFFDVGGHSLLATRLVSKIHEIYPKILDVFRLKDVLDAPTVVGVASRIQTCLASPSGAYLKQERIDLVREARDVLDATITDAINTSDTIFMSPKVVLLTGATGYLGAHILVDILETQDDVSVFCLLRASNDTDAMRRLLDTAPQHADKTYQSHQNRLVALAGDLAKPNFGLDLTRFRNIANKVDTIIHCAASVNLVQSYTSLKPVNVLGTKEILHFAISRTDGVVIPIHFISSNGVFPVDRSAYGSVVDEKNSGGVVVCEECHDDAIRRIAQSHLHEGYAQSKFVAEEMCSLAHSKCGLPISILRPGNMSAHSVSGHQNANDFVRLFLGGCIELGIVPDRERYAFDLTPVNFAASVVTHVACVEPSAVLNGRVVHLQHSNKPILLRDVAIYLRAIGHTLRSTDRSTFLRALRERCDVERRKNRKSASPSDLLRLESGFESFEKYFIASTWMRFDTKAMRDVLSQTRLVCPPIDQAYFRLMFPISDEGKEGVAAGSS